MKRVGIADLKARLSEHLRTVRRGGEILVVDRDTPIAKIVPYDSATTRLAVRPALGKRRIQDIPLPPPLDLGFDIVELLLEDRAKR